MRIIREGIDWKARSFGGSHKENVKALAPQQSVGGKGLLFSVF